MKAIHKYQLNSDGSETQLSLKEGFKIVHAEFVLVEKAVFVWVEEPLAAKIPTIEVPLTVVRSGEPLSKDFQHVSTAVDALAPEAYHIFQKVDAKATIYPFDIATGQTKRDFDVVNAR